MTAVRIVVPGKPVQWRVATAGKRFYNPPAQRRHMKLIQQYAKIAMGKRKPMQGHISGRIEFCMPMPKSWSKKKRAEFHGSYHCDKPDQTNCTKLVEDALTGIVYVDDRQISLYVGCIKYWALEGSTIIEYWDGE